MSVDNLGPIQCDVSCLSQTDMSTSYLMKNDGVLFILRNNLIKCTNG